MGKTLLVVIDAFRHDYLSEEHTPFLWSLREVGHYVEKLEPSFGFCERTEIIVGDTSQNLNYFTALSFNPTSSPYRKYSFALKILDKITYFFPEVLNRILNRLIWEIMSRTPGGFPRATIPLKFLEYFALTEDGLGSAIRCHSRSLYQLAKKNGWEINDSCFTSLDTKQFANDELRCDHILNVLDGNELLNMLYISDCDKFGHLYGPDSKKMTTVLQKVDRRLKTLHDNVVQKHPNLNIIFCGDHGMTTVIKRVDILGAVEKALSDYSYGSDYLLFADSTLFRIWSLNVNLKQAIEIKLKSLFEEEKLIEAGYLSTPEELGFKSDRQFGDWVWVAYPGTLVSPDFFSQKSAIVNGMHGYKTHNQSYGMSIGIGPAFTKKRVEEEKLTAVYDMLLIALGMESTGNAE